jgi:hypothetical protein
MAVTLSINVSNIAAAMASFNVIRIKRSTTGLNGTYNNLTDISPKPAVLQPPLPSPYNVSAKTLQIIRDSHPQVNIIFTGTDPLSAAQLVPQFNTALGAVVASEVLGQLVLTSTIVGTASKLTIVGGMAAPVFGWADGTKDVGEEAHIQLVAEQAYYSFTDNDGESTYYYKAQFLNTTNGLTSADSPAFQGDAGTLVDASNLSVAKVDLIDGRGLALADQEITFYGVNETFAIQGFQIALTRKPITIITDNGGHAEVPLVKGTRWKVVFEGTSFIREFVVPTSSTFDLLALLATAPDPFKIVEVQFPAAPRRTI